MRDIGGKIGTQVHQLPTTNLLDLSGEGPGIKIGTSPLGWHDLALFAIFEIEHIAADLVYFMSSIPKNQEICSRLFRKSKKCQNNFYFRFYFFERFFILFFWLLFRFLKTGTLLICCQSAIFFRVQLKKSANLASRAAKFLFSKNHRDFANPFFGATKIGVLDFALVKGKQKQNRLNFFSFLASNKP